MKKQQSLSPPPLCLSNRQRVERRISRQLLTCSAWLPTNWNTITVKPHTETHVTSGIGSVSAVAVMKQTCRTAMAACVCVHLQNTLLLWTLIIFCRCQCHSSPLSFCLFTISTSGASYPRYLDSGRWDGVGWFVSPAFLPSDLDLICNRLWPSVPALKLVWYVTRSVSPLPCAWFVALSSPSASHLGERGQVQTCGLVSCMNLGSSFLFISGSELEDCIEANRAFHKIIKQLQSSPLCLSVFLI